jgi:hypothetical protein
MLRETLNGAHFFKKMKMAFESFKKIVTKNLDVENYGIC